MKEKYIDRINALGKVGGIVINVLKGITIAVMVLIVISYLFLDSLGKGIVSINVCDKVELSMDLREFGFIYSEKDKVEQKQYEKFHFDTDYKAAFDEPQAGFGKVVVGEFIKTKLILAGKNDVEVDNIYVDKADTYLLASFAYSLIPWGLFGPSFSVASVSSIKQYSVSMGLNFVTIFVIIVLLFLVYVFKYGALLQQESDETL